MSVKAHKNSDEYFHLPNFGGSYSNTEGSTKKGKNHHSLEEKDSSDELTIGPAAHSKFFEKTLSQSSLLDSIESAKQPSPPPERSYQI